MIITQAHRWFLFVVILLSVIKDASGQERADTVVSWMAHLYQNFQYEEAIRKGRQALENPSGLKNEHLVEIHQWLALSHAALGQFEKAKDQFREALIIDENLTLDPVLTSPKIISLFEDVKNSLKSQEAKLASLRWKQWHKKRVGSIYRSLVFPGWGQVYQGRKTRGRILMALTTATLGSLIYSQIQFEHYQDKYHNAREQSQIDRFYDQYNTFYKIRNGLAIVTLSLWIYAHFDVEFFSGSDLEKTSHIPRIEATPESFTLCWCFNF